MSTFLALSWDVWFAGEAIRYLTDNNLGGKTIFSRVITILDLRFFFWDIKGVNKKNEEKKYLFVISRLFDNYWCLNCRGLLNRLNWSPSLGREYLYLSWSEGS